MNKKVVIEVGLLFNRNLPLDHRPWGQLNYAASVKAIFINFENIFATYFDLKYINMVVRSFIGLMLYKKGQFGLNRKENPNRACIETLILPKSGL